LSEANINTSSLQQIFAKFGLKNDKKTIFVMGGSQGAHSINNAMIEALNSLTTHKLKASNGTNGLEPFASKVQIIHQTGQDEYDLIKSEYEKTDIVNLVQPYFENIPEIYALADLMICRTGAMTMAEITAYGLPAILVPYPYSTGGHQLINAQAMARKDAAIVIEESELTGEILAQNIIDLLENEPRLRQMAIASKRLGKPRAAEKIAEAVLKRMKNDE
jgi:UDP-N-acetylglucosamine--N-acetylmuramyl-(pentapeptide) pyrophosphoryl-undecaprenol N-acetylglucosamine transferase